jgi:hypothetical protein
VSFTGLINVCSKSEFCSCFLHLAGSKHFLCAGSSSWEGRIKRHEICCCGLGCLKRVDDLGDPDVEVDVSTTDNLVALVG